MSATSYDIFKTKTIKDHVYRHNKHFFSWNNDRLIDYKNQMVAVRIQLGKRISARLKLDIEIINFILAFRNTEKTRMTNAATYDELKRIGGSNEMLKSLKQDIASVDEEAWRLWFSQNN